MKTEKPRHFPSAICPFCKNRRKVKKNGYFALHGDGRGRPNCAGGWSKAPTTEPEPANP